MTHATFSRSVFTVVFALTIFTLSHGLARIHLRHQIQSNEQLHRTGTLSLWHAQTLAELARTAPYFTYNGKAYPLSAHPILFSAVDPEGYAHVILGPEPKDKRRISIERVMTEPGPRS